MGGKLDVNQPAILLNPANFGLVSCNQTKACIRGLSGKFLEDNQWGLAVQSSANAHQCDHCFQLVPIRDIHRCQLMPLHQLALSSIEIIRCY